MGLPQSRGALLHARLAVFKLHQVRERPEEFVIGFRSCIALVTAVGAAINNETPGASADWWGTHLEPDKAAMMKLRTAALKHNDDSLDPNWSPASWSESARLRRTGRSQVLRPGVQQPQQYLPKWRIRRGFYEGKDPVAVLEEYLVKLEKILRLAEAYAEGPPPRQD